MSTIKEIEFAVNLYHEEDKINEFSLLQIKPMVVGGLDRIQEFSSIQKQNILWELYLTEKKLF